MTEEDISVTIAEATPIAVAVDDSQNNFNFTMTASGPSGASGKSGYSGFSGFSGFSGASGTSGFSGASGTSGISGFSGMSGASTSGYSGASGFSGASGTSGFSGASGTSGFSGASGTSGFSGASGTSGTSGFSGASGTSGFSGASGTSGFSGASGTSGFSGESGASGTSGFSGASGTSGFSGISGFSGASGASGASGFSGASGTSGTSGFSGASGQVGAGVVARGAYDAGTTYNLNDLVSYNNSTWVSLHNTNQGNTPVEGADWSLFAEQGVSGFSGASGTSGFSGESGASGTSGFSGISGFSGASGTSGFSGASGASGTSGFSGASGVSGFSGASGTSGFSGTSGTSGFSGASGTSGFGSALAIDINRFGFINRTETSISFNGTKTFTLTDSGSGWSYYRSGVKYTISGNKVIDLTSPGDPVDGTLYYIYIDGTTGALSVNTGGWTLNDTKVPVATVYWDSGLTPNYILADERHTVKIDRAWHREHHFVEGTTASVFGSVTGLTAASDAPGDKTFGISGTQLFDEDLKFTLSELADPDGATPVYYILYRTSATTYDYVASDMPFKYTTSAGPAYGYIEYDLNGTSTPSDANRFVNTYIYASNSVSNSEADPEISTASTRYFIMQGRGSYTTAAAAQAEKFLVSAGMPIAEGVALYQITWATTNRPDTVKGRCRYLSIQQVQANNITTSVITATSHNGLAGLQGGTTDEYYHLTSAEYTALQATGGSGISGYSGFSGASGTSGFSGASGTSGTSGFSGASGTSGFSGASGTSGFSGASGTSGFSGASGTSGFSGASGSGISGFSGASGKSGFSGVSGASTSGFSGASGTSGFSGASGTSGFSGASGTSGFSGASGSGISGFSGASGKSGFSGVSGASTSGYSGASGISGFSGISGYSGASGFSGVSGFSGSGISGFSGYSGASGAGGAAVWG